MQLAPPRRLYRIANTGPPIPGLLDLTSLQGCDQAYALKLLFNSSSMFSSSVPVLHDLARKLLKCMQLWSDYGENSYS